MRGADSAIWSRLKLIPFTITIPKDEMDEHLLDKLKAEAPGVLAWAVQGSLDWQRDGLVEPQEVLDSVATWKCEDDPFKEFFEDRCEFSPAEATPVTNMWSEFRAWAVENGMSTRLAPDSTNGCVCEDAQRPWRGTRAASRSAAGRASS